MWPYAPLLRVASFSEGRLSPWWLWTIGGISFFFMVMMVALFAYVIAQWREREQQLAAAYATLQEQKEKLVRAESLAAVGSLVSGAAHELRNPLSSSGALLQELAAELSNPGSAFSEEARAEAAQGARLALKGQQRAAGIVERLYRLSEEMELRGSSEQIGESMEALGRRYPSLRIEMDPSLASVRVSSALPRTVLPNLVDNALAAGGSEPPVLEVRVARDGALEPVAETAPPLLEFTVSDSGRGIPEALKKDVFKPFVTGQKTGEGHSVGLGLYLVHELVTRMGGEVEFESEEGKGTRVSVRVPGFGPADS